MTRDTIVQRVNRRLTDDPIIRFKTVAFWLLSVGLAFVAGTCLASNSLDQTYRVLLQTGTALGVVGGVVWALWSQGTRTTVENLQQVVESQEKLILELQREYKDFKEEFDDAKIKADAAQAKAKEEADGKIERLETEIKDVRTKYDEVVKLNLELQRENARLRGGTSHENP